MYIADLFCAIGAAVARFPDTEEVTGSIPVSRTERLVHQTRQSITKYAVIAQLVERNLAKVEVASSNLVDRSKEFLGNFEFCRDSSLNLRRDWRSGSALP